MKLWKFILAALAFLMVCTTFTNCSKSDDNGGSSRSIVGTWVEAGYYEETFSYRFNSDGSFIETYEGKGSFESSRGDYVYNSGWLELNYDDGYRDSTPVEWIDNNHILLWDSEFVRR